MPSYVIWVVGTSRDGRLHGRRRRALFAFTADGHPRHELDDRALAGRSGPSSVFVAISVIGFVFLACTSVCGLLMTYGLIAPTRKPWFPMSFSMGWASDDEPDRAAVHDPGRRRHQLPLRSDRRPDGRRNAGDHRRRHGSRHITHRPFFFPDKKAAKKTKTAGRAACTRGVAPRPAAG